MPGLIVVATDLSPRSFRALLRAQQLANEHDAKLSILHVVDRNLPGRLLSSFSEQIRVELLQQATGCGVDVGGTSSVHVVAGSTQTIAQFAERQGADLIVLGMHDTGLSEEPRFGAKTEYVLRSTSTPVLIARDRAAGPYKRVAIAVDFSELSRAALRTAVELAPAAKFHLLHVYEIPLTARFKSANPAEPLRKQTIQETRAFLAEEMRGLAEGHISGAGPRFSIAVDRGEPSRRLRREAERIRAELLVVGSHGRSTFTRFFLGSVASSLIASPPCDLLVIRHQTAGRSPWSRSRASTVPMPQEDLKKVRAFPQQARAKRPALLHCQSATGQLLPFGLVNAGDKNLE